MHGTVSGIVLLQVSGPWDCADEPSGGVDLGAILYLHMPFVLTLTLTVTTAAEYGGAACCESATLAALLRCSSPH